MAPIPSAQRQDREKKLKAVLSQYHPSTSSSPFAYLYAAFASGLSSRLNDSHDTSLLSDIRLQLFGLPLQNSSTVAARQEDLETLGIELWNLAIRLRRDEPPNSGRTKDQTSDRRRTLCLAQCYSVLLLDSAGNRASKNEQYKNCVRLMKVALKAARVSIESNELESATKVLERAAVYQETLSKNGEGQSGEEAALADRLQAEYFAMRTALVSTITTNKWGNPDGHHLLKLACRPGVNNRWIWQSTCT